MKKLIKIFPFFLTITILFSGFVFFSNYVSAEKMQKEGLGSSAPQKNMEIENPDPLKEKTKSKERVEDRNREKRQQRIVGVVEKIVSRLTSALKRLVVLKERVESRIKKFEDREINMDQPIALLVLVDSKIEEAGQSIEKVSIMLSDINTEFSEENLLSELKTVIGEAKDSIKEVHKALVEVIKAIKASDKVSTNEENE